MPRNRPSSSVAQLPLDYLLGTVGNVRALRVLSASTSPVSQAELARRARLSLSGIPSLLEKLEALGVISYVGAGRTRQVRLERSHPMARSVAQLFLDEDQRWKRIVAGLTNIAKSQGALILSAWAELAPQRNAATASESVVFGVLSDERLGLQALESLRQMVNALQRDEHAVVFIKAYQRADLVRFSRQRMATLEGAILLHGLHLRDVRNASLPSGARVGRERRRTRASQLEIATAIAQQLTRDPELIGRARAYLNHRLGAVTGGERFALLEWQGLLDALTPSQIAQLLREDSEHADELRQNLPFIDALTDAERDELFARTP